MDPKKMPETNPVWPVGARLRMKLDAALQEKYRQFRGTPVVVLGQPEWRPPSDGFPEWAWRQRVLAYAYSIYGSVWAQPAHLEPIPGIAMLPGRDESPAPGTPVH